MVVVNTLFLFALYDLQKRYGSLRDVDTKDYRSASSEQDCALNPLGL